jgi:hypothetical protein
LEARVHRPPPARVERLRAGQRYGNQRATALTRELLEVVLPQGLTRHAEARASGAGRRGGIGRIDWLGEIEGSRAALVGEIKNSDWDAMRRHRVVPNARRHGRQLWRYLEAPEVGQIGQAWVQLFVEYPHRPNTPGRAQLIEEVLADYGVTVAWVDE